MTRRRYDQPCSLACALDRVGDRWALLIVRELTLGPLRFSDLARSVGGAPTDVLTQRLRDLEQDEIVRRVELVAPASGSAYELTELGRELEPALVALGRWGLNFQRATDALELTPSWLPNALRVMLQPPTEAALTLQVETDGQEYRLRIEDGWISVARGHADNPDLSLAGAPGSILAALAGVDAGAVGAEVAGDEDVLAELRQMVVLPERLRNEVLGALSGAVSASAP